MKQNGFTLLEILVVTAVGGVILIGAMVTLIQIISSTQDSKSLNQALTDVNRAALQIKKDIQSTHNSDLVEGISQNTTDLSWTDFSLSDNNTHSSNYTLSGTNLLRGSDGTTSVVGRHITGLTFTRTGRVVDVVITATSNTTPPVSETLEFSIYMRSEAP
jgi:type II secretion system protein J